MTRKVTRVQSYTYSSTLEVLLLGFQIFLKHVRISGDAVLATRTVNPGTGKFSLPVPVKSTGVQLILVMPQDEKS